ncbi:chalcone--flavonone isomerase [Oryza brachyantha]|uniref:Chalcone-flavonone isomerase family protein n=1 Tax=Oryza brachyantha TaxID=4533 RepID=J3LU70_ORYBR|nr:chalcone--flavonone isomerase [Oryza brachyantha]
MAAVSEVEVDGVVFPPVARPPGSAGRTHFLAGAGVRGMEIAGNFIKFTAIGVYLEDAAVPALGKKWAGKSADELAVDGAFFRDVVTGDFEKFTRVTMILPLTGEQYSEKVTENCVKAWKAAGVYTDAEGAAADKFKDAFKPHSFPPGASILFTHSPAGVLTVAFSKDSSVPEDGAAAAAIENRALCEAVLDSIIGEHGVSPAAKRSIASRVTELLKADATGDVPAAAAAAAETAPVSA